MMSAAQKAEMEKRDKKTGVMAEESVGYYYQQTITFTPEQLPEIEKWEVGKEYEITIKARMQTYENRKVADNKPKKEARFEVIAVKSDSPLTSEQKKIKDHMTKDPMEINED